MLRLGGANSHSATGQRWAVHCPASHDGAGGAGEAPGCHPTDNNCARVVMDDFITAAETARLLAIAETGMASMTASGGATILDILSGYVRDSEGMGNLHEPSDYDAGGAPLLSQLGEADYALYQDVIERIRAQVMREFGLSTLYATAPTFITREVGSFNWEPASDHDEYWHPHVDKANTPHYDYSGLLYLSDYGIDFTGGLFGWHDGK